MFESDLTGNSGEVFFPLSFMATIGTFVLRSFGFGMLRLIAFIFLISAFPAKADLLMSDEDYEEPEINYYVRGLARFSKEFDFYYSDKPHGKDSKIHVLKDGKAIPLNAKNGLERIYIWGVSKKTNLKTQCYAGIYDFRDVKLRLDAIKYNVLVFNFRRGPSLNNGFLPAAPGPGNNPGNNFLLFSLAALLTLTGLYFKNRKVQAVA